MIERCWIASAPGLGLTPVVLYDQASADWYRERKWAVTEMIPAGRLEGAVESVRAHYDGWVKANGRASGNMRPADRELWIAVLGPEFGGQ